MEIKALCLIKRKLQKDIVFLASTILSMDFCLSHSCNTTLVAIKRTSQDDTKLYM